MISVYTRAQALEDGVLVDVSEMAREASFTVPVAVTRAVWALVDPTEAEQEEHQSVQGRLWDLLWMAFLAARLAGDGSERLFKVAFVLRGRQGERSGLQTVELKLHSGPGDEGEHVITIMIPEED